MIFFRKKRRIKINIDPDEIFLDDENIPGFDTQQFEGKLEKPISKKTHFLTGIFFLCFGLLFIFKLFNLQVVYGEDFFLQSQKNSFHKEPIFADRGIVYDRFGNELIRNVTDSSVLEFAGRAYPEESGFSHILGFVSYPNRDATGKFWQTEFVGKDGVEKQFNEILKGENGTRLFETNALGEVFSENKAVLPIQGENVTLSIDRDMQTVLYESIEKLAQRTGFVGGAGIVMDVENGEILAMGSYPEFDSGVLSTGSDRETIYSYQTDSRKPYLNRAISGLYTPGSIVKPFLAIGALEENIISPEEEIYSPGYIEIPNPYNPENPTVFREARGRVHGLVDMRKALAVSSNVYFMAISGGYNEKPGLGIDGIEKYSKMFELGEETGISLGGEVNGTIPSISWKGRIFPDDPWRLGDTYNTSIGQYGFQVTPLQVVRAVSAIANKGELLTPTIVLGDDVNKNNTKKLNIEEESFNVIHEGMRLAVLEGTAQALLFSDFDIAAKTGTAEVGVSKQKVNSWAIGFFPYENPKYAFVILMDSAPVERAEGAVLVARDLLSWFKDNRLDTIGE